MNKNQYAICFQELDNNSKRDDFPGNEAFDVGFEQGFKAAINLQDKKLKAYAAYINGKITRSELDNVLSNHSG